MEGQRRSRAGRTPPEGRGRRPRWPAPCLVRRAAGCTWPGDGVVAPRLTEGPGSPDAAAVAPQSPHGGCPHRPYKGAHAAPADEASVTPQGMEGGHARWEWKK